MAMILDDSFPSSYHIAVFLCDRLDESLDRILSCTSNQPTKPAEIIDLLKYAYNHEQSRALIAPMKGYIRAYIEVYDTLSFLDILPEDRSNKQ